MALEEKVLIRQFGQGVYSLTDMLDQFRALPIDEQRHRFLSLNGELSHYTWRKTDIEQALADFAPDDAQVLYDYLRLHQFTARWVGIGFIPPSDSPPNGRLDVVYQVLLRLYKLHYHRYFAVQESRAEQHQDLSDTVAIEDELAKHRNLVEQVYAEPSYRSEFACLAKSWRNDKLRYQTSTPDSSDKPQTHFDSLTYTELVADAIAPFIGGTTRGLFLLRQSLTKALAKQYQLSDEQVNRLIIDVIDRHLREMPI